MPKLFDKDAWKKCEKSCDHDFCCNSDCYLKTYNLTDATGKFDAAAAKTYIKKAVNNDAAWPIDSIVDDCVATAPAKLKEFEDKMAAHKGKDGKKDDKKEKKCANPENFVIGQCIRRGLIIQCPTWAQNESCTSLMTFAKSCPMYPFKDCDGHDGKDIEKKEKKSEKKPAKKSKREADDDKDAKKEERKAKKEEKKAERESKKEEKKAEREAKKAEHKQKKEERKANKGKKDKTEED